MMESDLQITVKGLERGFASQVGEAVGDVVRELNNQLDFRRMHRIVVTTDFAGELKELSAQTVSRNPITHTNEDYAVAVAKVMLLPLGNEYEIVPVINAHIVSVLATENEDDLNEDQFNNVLHYLHHELCHVHDDNKKIDALHDVMLKQPYVGKEMFIGPLAEACWSEYYANRLSSTSVTETAIVDLTMSFKDAIIRTKPLIDKEILSYRFHADLNRLMAAVERHGGFLVRAAAYTLGYVDGLEKPLPQLSPEADATLNNSYFQSTWDAIHDALREMYKLYPGGWKKLSVYDGLATALEHYYAEMGLLLSTMDDGRAYVNVPFRKIPHQNKDLPMA